MSTLSAPGPASVRNADSPITEDDLYLFNEGTHYDLWKKLGAQPMRQGNATGIHFAVWAPNAAAVSVIGDFNQWDNSVHQLVERNTSGIWQGLVPELGSGTRYKYHITSRKNGYEVDKADPFAFHQEPGPGRASVVWDLSYEWQDHNWMNSRHERNRLTSPISIYEVHLGSWRRRMPDRNRS